MKRFLSLTLSLLLLLTCLPAAGAAEEPASWAAPAVDYLLEHEYVDREYAADFTRPVSRQEFAYYAVKLYEALTGKKADQSASPFPDTRDPWVGSASQLGLVSGVGDGTFAPDLPVTREQVAVLMLRSLKKAGVAYNEASVDHISFSDPDISGWALNDVKRAYHIGVMNGVGGNSIAPQRNVTRQETFVLLYNVLTQQDRLRAGHPRVEKPKTLQAPVLKYKNAGAYESGWCEEAYNSSPAVCDLDGDGKLEIVTAAYSIRAFDAASGKMLWRAPSGFDKTQPDASYAGRAWADVITQDIDGDGKPEIITGHRAGADGSGLVSVLTWDGYTKPGWPQKLPAEVKSVKAADLDGDGTCEIVVGAGTVAGTNVWVYEHNGALRAGWPQLNDAKDGAKYSNADGAYVGYAWGVFNDSIAVGDLDGDPELEILVPSDVPFVCAYNPDGSLVPASDQFGGVSWGNVGFWENAAFEASVENGGWGLSSDPYTGAAVDVSTLPREKRYTANFTFGKAIFSDLDGDGTEEVVVTGNMYDRALGYPPLGSKYFGLFVLNKDRTRFQKGAYDWTTTPETGKPLSEDWAEIELCMPDPVAEDLDGDGVKEILYPSYDGTLQCFRLDRKPMGSWPKKVYDGKTKEFASSPAAVDVNGDGRKEVIFTTFTAKQGTKKGSLYLCDDQGNTLFRTDLPDSLGNTTPNGCMASPVVRDIDGDGTYEVILNTYYSALVVYQLPLV